MSRYIKISTIIFLLFLPSVFSLGITPVKKIINYEPGCKIKGEIQILNSRSSEVLISLSGELSPYLTLSKTRLNISKFDTVSYIFNCPEEIEPGLHESKIIIKEVPLDSEGAVSIKPGIVLSHIIELNVPYPGKYIKPSLDIPKVSPGEELIAYISLANLGKENLEIIARSNFEGNIQEKTIFINNGDKDQLIFNYSTKGIVQGDHTFNISIDYGTKKTISKTVRIEGFILNITSLTLNTSSSIAKLEISVKNLANRAVTADLVVETLDFTYPSPSLELQPFEEKITKIFLEDISKASLENATLKLSYEGKEINKTFRLGENGEVLIKEIILWPYLIITLFLLTIFYLIPKYVHH